MYTYLIKLRGMGRRLERGGRNGMEVENCRYVEAVGERMTRDKHFLPERRNAAA